MTDTQALRDLLDAIEVGGELPRPLPFPVWQSALVLEAYRGSLDAAKALHEAVLPGWLWFVGHLDSKELGFCCTVSNQPFADALSFRAFSSTPARAWLIAILRALIAQAEQ